ncbi:MAG: DUF1987 domain-containing protein [Bacteroidia bacterium]|nr:DUF1987 domain-containing protein [Bacteroidia bacterium]
MELFFLDASDKTPLIILDKGRGKFELNGVSVPENGQEFYKPVLKWFTDYSAHPLTETMLHVNLDYFNISSSKMILFIFYKLMEIKDSGKKVEIVWHYSDELIFEAGTDYEYITGLDFIYEKISKAKLAE